jgi:hypothetical protein
LPDWRFTKFSPDLLDWLAAWQQEFDYHYHWEQGRESDEARDHHRSDALAEDQESWAELGIRGAGWPAERLDKSCLQL